MNLPKLIRVCFIFFVDFEICISFSHSQHLAYIHSKISNTRDEEKSVHLFEKGTPPPKIPTTDLKVPQNRTSF